MKKNPNKSEENPESKKEYEKTNIRKLLNQKENMKRTNLRKMLNQKDNMRKEKTEKS